MTAFASFALLLLSACSPDDAGRQRKARELIGEERYEEARAELQAVEVLNADGWLATGVLRGEDGDDEGALEAFSEGLTIEPLPELYVNDCIVRLRLSRGAMAACQEAVLKAPLDPRASVGLAEAATREGSTEAAKEALFTASDLVGEDRDTMAWMAEVWAALDELEAACTWGLRSGVDTTVTGTSCVHAGRPQEGIAILERVGDAPACRILFTFTLDEAEASPEGPVRQKAIGRAERWERCTVDEGQASMLVDRGRLLMLTGDRLSAEALWRQAILLAPDEVAPRLNLARSLLHRGQSEGRELLERSGTFHTAPGLVFSLELVALDREGGKLEAALRRAQEAAAGCLFVESSPCSAQANYEIARLHALRGEQSLSLAALERALEHGGPSLKPRIEAEPDFGDLREGLAYYDLVNSSP